MIIFPLVFNLKATLPILKFQHIATMMVHKLLKFTKKPHIPKTKKRT